MNAPVAETELSGGLQGVLLTSADASGLGIVVLGGSSGRVEVARARLFAERGATALAMRWFGGEGQPPGICEIPLESFTVAIDRLSAEGCTRFAILGTSKGAEAALLVAAEDRRVDIVIAISPSSLVWANADAGRDGESWPLRSSWTRNGVPLPFVPYDVEWYVQQQPPPAALRPYHERSLASFPQTIEPARIPVESAHADIILVAGEDDALWPSAPFAREIAARLRAHGKEPVLVTHPDAGHRLILRGEPAMPRPEGRDWGGTDEADAELGRAAWEVIAAKLGLGGA